MGCGGSKTRSHNAPAPTPNYGGSDSYQAASSQPQVRQAPPPKKKEQFQELDEFGNPRIRFFTQAKARLDRQYILIVDKSGSMSGGRWNEAHQAVKALASHITEFDPDGVDVIFFNSEPVLYRNVKSADDVDRLFNSEHPSSSTDLTKALRTAFQLHFAGPRTGTTILCVTDGEPDSQDDVAREIVAAAAAIARDEELSLSFVQIGNDDGATRFLQKLDEGLEAKFDIVDTLTAATMKGMSFEALVNKSIND